MSEVDFYVLDGAGEEEARLRVACRIAEKGWTQGLRVFVLAADQRQAGRMDEMLWLFRQDSFVPHERWPSSSPVACVQIGDGNTPPPDADVMINLATELPSDHRRYARIAEIVGGDSADRTRARARYRAYRDSGAQLRSHEIRS